MECFYKSCSNYSMEEDEEILDNELLIVVGARVMLTSNLWTNAILVNGALRVVEHIVYNLGTFHHNPPTYVLVRFDNYVGVPWDELFPHTIPIISIERGNNRQIPLRVSWGLTIDRFQGLKLEKETINIRKIKRQGLTFTAISPELNICMVFHFNLHFHMIDMKRWESVLMCLKGKLKKTY
jgi:hypothetical protein